MRKRFLTIVLVCAALGGCRSDTILGFAIGDISGLWVGVAYVYADGSSGGTEVDLIARDGARFTMTVANDANPPVVGSTFADGQGAETSAGGVVDIALGTLTIGSHVFEISHSGDEMTIVNSATMFDFGSGSRAASLRIDLIRP